MNQIEKHKLLEKKLDQTHKLFERFKIENFALTMELLNEYRKIWDVKP